MDVAGRAGTDAFTPPPGPLASRSPTVQPLSLAPAQAPSHWKPLEAAGRYRATGLSMHGEITSCAMKRGEVCCCSSKCLNFPFFDVSHGREVHMRPQLLFAPEILHVRHWPDEVIDHLGWDPRSSYVEDYWLGILGPSTTWLLRRLAAGFDYSPEGFDLDLGETARSLGLGDRSGRHSPFIRSINRTVQFGLAQLSGPAELSVRRRVPPLNRAQLSRLSPALRARHAAWQEEQSRLPAGELQLRRARQLALSLLELGDGYDSAERQLLRWRYPSALAREAVAWAGAQMRSGPLDDPGAETGAAMQERAGEPSTCTTMWHAKTSAGAATA